MSDEKKGFNSQAYTYACEVIGMSAEIKILGNMTLVLDKSPNPGPMAFLDRRE